MKRVAVTGFAVLALMLLGAGLALGFVPVSVASGTSCGSAFHGSDPTTDGLTDSGQETCTQLRTAHRPDAVALLVAGGVALLGTFGIAEAASDGDDYEPMPTPPDETPSGPPPTMYGHKS